MDSSYLLLAVGGCGVAVSAYLTWSSVRDRHWVQLRDRLHDLSTRNTGFDDRATPSDRAADRRPSNIEQVFTPWLRRLLPGKAEERRDYDLRFKQAGLTHSASLTCFFAARLVGLIVPFFVVLACGRYGLLKPHWVLLDAVMAGTLGWLAPMYWLERRIKHRHTQLRRALPDFMDLMIVCLESGLSVPAALQRVSAEISLPHPVLSHELDIVQRDTALGSTMDAAFQRFAERSGLDAAKTLATFVRESRRFGSEIVEALRQQAEAMRYQREQAAEENAQKASVKILFPMLLLILPAVFIVLAGPAVIQIQKAFAK